MGGNTSVFKIYHDGETQRFVKIKNAKDFDLNTFVFQSQLSKNFNGRLKINKPICIKCDTEGKVNIEYEYIKSFDWNIDSETIALLGINLAHLHNYCYNRKHKIHLNTKSQNLDFTKWNEVEDSFSKNLSYEIRKTILEKLQPYNTDQPLIPVHRDFKTHNILFDGKDFQLIDFDFAANDNIGIEIMSFIIDFYYITNDRELVNTFVDSYKMMCSVKGLNWTTLVNDYLVYMCCNTFPFYMRNDIGEVNFQLLLKERNNKLNFTYINKDFLNESLSR